MREGFPRCQCRQIVGHAGSSLFLAIDISGSTSNRDDKAALRAIASLTLRLTATTKPSILIYLVWSTNSDQWLSNSLVYRRSRKD